MGFLDRIKKNPRNSQELAIKRLAQLHPEDAPKTLIATLERILELEATMDKDVRRITAKDETRIIR